MLLVEKDVATTLTLLPFQPRKKIRNKKFFHCRNDWIKQLLGRISNDEGKHRGEKTNGRISSRKEAVESMIIKF